MTIPICNIVKSNSVIYVHKKCNILIEWNGNKKGINYLSSYPFRSIIEIAIKEFDIHVSASELYLLSSTKKQFNTNDNIPFDGIKDTCIKLLRSSNMVIDNESSSDENEEITISEEGRNNNYPLQSAKTIQYYYDKVLTVYELISIIKNRIGIIMI